LHRIVLHRLSFHILQSARCCIDEEPEDDLSQGSGDFEGSEEPEDDPEGSDIAGSDEPGSEEGSPEPSEEGDPEDDDEEPEFDEDEEPEGLEGQFLGGRSYPCAR
jgi:hypothetical protein